MATSSMGSWPPDITLFQCNTGHGEHDMAISLTTHAEFLQQSLSDYTSIRSIPPLTMKSWMAKEFPINYIVDGTHRVTEMLPRLTVQGSIERVPPEQRTAEYQSQ